MFEIICKEINVIQENHQAELKEYEELVGNLKSDAKVLNLEIAQLKAKIKNPPEYAHKSVQLQVENLLDFKEPDDLDHLNSNLNTFIACGKLQTTEWVNAVITDLISSKLVADYKDYKQGYVTLD